MELQIRQQKMSVRPTAVAGTFYPANAAELQMNVDALLEKVESPIPTPKAIIAPHAGYVYSGPTAARVYASLKQSRQTIRRVVLLGPAHRVYTKGIALSSATHFATPLGNIAIDTHSQQEIAQLDFVNYFDDAHQQEHSLEVHLPFLQSTLDDFLLIPLVVGDATPEQVAKVLEQLWGDQHTLIIISSDLSHFHDYDTANQIDTDTCEQISNFNYQAIGSKQACGCMPMRGLLLLGKKKQMNIELIERCNSGDTAGDKKRVVGYCAYALNETTESTQQTGILNEKTSTQLFKLARQSIESGLKTNKAIKPNLDQFPVELHEHYAVFVTVTLNGQLRGCIGTTEPIMSLVNAVADNAYKAAFRDPRFKPLSEAEYSEIKLSLSILTPKSSLAFKDEKDLLNKLVPNKDGLIIEKGRKRATFLPVVWETLSEPEQFLGQLKLKAGMTKAETPDKAWRYGAEYYSE